MVCRLHHSLCGLKLEVGIWVGHDGLEWDGLKFRKVGLNK